MPSWQSNVCQRKNIIKDRSIMELQEFCRLFKEHRKPFFVLFLLPALAVILHGITQPIAFESTVVFAVTRNEDQEGQEKVVETERQNIAQSDEYDAFYRISADEKVTATLVAWLQTPDVVGNIFNERVVGIKPSTYKKWVKTEKIAPQLAHVQFSSPTPQKAQDEGGRLIKEATRLSHILDTDKTSGDSFLFQASNITTAQKSYPWKMYIATAIIIGLCMGTLGILLRHYTKSQWEA